MSQQMVHGIAGKQFGRARMLRARRQDGEFLDIGA